MDEREAWAVLLPDGQVHLARPGHVNCVCGAHRISNADTVNAEPTCLACVERFRADIGADPVLLEA